MREAMGMAAGNDLPISETFGVFLGVTGVDWLADGYAEPLKAAGLSVAAGILIFLFRTWSRKRHRKD